MVTTSARDLLMLNQKLKPKLIQKHGMDMVDMVVMDTHMVDTDMATTMENRK